MTVKELKERLDKCPDDSKVEIKDPRWRIPMDIEYVRLDGDIVSLVIDVYEM